MSTATTASAAAPTIVGDVGRSDGHGEHHPRRPFTPDGLERGLGGDAGGEPVVDHDHVTAGQRDPRPAVPIERYPLLDTRPLGGGELGEALAVDTAVARPLLRHHLHAALGDGADAELGLLGCTDLAHHDDVERQPEARRHRRRHHHAAARQADDHAARRRLAPSGQLVGQAGPRLGAVAEPATPHEGDSREV